MTSLASEIRIAARSLFRRPGFTLTAVVTLALGIGAATAMFGALYGVLLRPLPYPEPERLVWAWGTFSGGRNASVSPPDFLDFRQATEGKAFASLAAVGSFPLQLNVRSAGGGDPERVQGAMVSAGFFSTLGVEPALGRGFAADEERDGAPRVAVVSHGFWQRMLAGDPGALGREIELDGYTGTLVGVMPEGFDFPAGTEVWAPIPFGGAGTSVRRFHFLRPVGRLAAGVSPAAAERALNTVAERLEAEYPESNSTWRVRLQPLHEGLLGAARAPLWALFAAVGLLLAIACANVAALLLVRGAGRQREMAVRSALGAGPARVARQLLVESLLLAAAGGAGGLLIAAWGVAALRHLATLGLPRADSLALSPQVVVFAVAVTLLTGLLAGMVPAADAARVRLAGALSGSRGGEGRSRIRLRAALVVAQVAVSVVLVAGAGLLVRSLLSLQAVDPGMDTRGVLTAAVRLPDVGYEEDARRSAFFDRLLTRLRALPGVEEAAAIDMLPLSGGGGDTAFHRPEAPPATPAERQYSEIRQITPGYFRALGVPLLAGRGLTAADHAQAPPVVIVNQAFARQWFGDDNPVGQRLVVDLGDAVEAEVVGLVGDVRQYGPASPGWPAAYLPRAQLGASSMNLVVRTAGDPYAVAGGLRAAVAELDAAVPVAAVTTLGATLDSLLAPARLRTVLLALFAVAALLLACLGLYGTLAYQVRRQTRDTGVRLALGARTADVLRRVAGQGMLLAATGIVLGLAGAVAAGRLLGSLLHGVGPADPLALGGAALALAAAALAASLIPARRAARTDPAIALRHDL